MKTRSMLAVALWASTAAIAGAVVYPLLLRPGQLYKAHIPPMSAAVLLVLLLACASWSCGPSAAPPGTATVVDTLPSGAIHVHHRSLSEEAAAFSAQEVVRIGAAEGEGPAVFGRVQGFALDAMGEQLFVFDSHASELRIFRLDGAHVRTVGRRGGGPGEFQDVRGLIWRPTGTLWVMDYANQRYTELTADGDFVATYARRVRPFGSGWDGAFDREDRLYDVAVVTDRTGTRRLYVRHEVRERELVPTDSFPLPEAATDTYTLSAPFGYVNIPVPYAPQLSWTFDGEGGIWAGTGARYRIRHHLLRGDTLRILEVDHEPGPVTPAERESAVADLRGVLERIGGDVRQVDLSRIPQRHPAHGRLVLDAGGRLWVARVDVSADASTSSTTFDIFSPDGSYLGAVSLGIGTSRAPAFSGNLVAGLSTDELGVHRIVVYRLSPPETTGVISRQSR